MTNQVTHALCLSEVDGSLENQPFYTHRPSFFAADATNIDPLDGSPSAASYPSSFLASFFFASIRS